jgi:hypothetical protein
MSKENGFLPLRRGIWEHVRDGNLTYKGALIYIYMLSQADTRTGVWKGCAKSISSVLRIPLSTVKYALTRLDNRYIKRFTIPGKHSCYPILCHRFVITQGQHVGLRLDALNSTNEKSLSFIPDDEPTARVPDVVQLVGRQRIQETRNKRLEKKKEAPAAPLLSFSGLHFSVTEKQDALLGEGFPWIDRPVEYRKVDSWLEANPERRPKKSSRFLHNWFSRIAQPKEGTNGNQNISAEERIRQGDIAAARFLANNCGVAAEIRPSAVPEKREPKTVH